VTGANYGFGQCAERLDDGRRCLQAAYGADSWCYFHGKLAHGLTRRVHSEPLAAPVSAEEKGERAEAREVLRSLLADGPMDATEVVKASGINAASLKRPRKDLGIIAEARRNMLGRVVGWTWRLPEDHRYNPTRLTESCTPGSPGHTQDKYTVSAPEEQPSESGPLDFGAVL
jgi:hypothetical protein